MEELITIVIPVYNVEAYIDRCIESVRKQTYSNLEIILVDDGSPDKCPEICDEYAKKDKRIKVIHKENGGVSSARNIGIENSTGVWLCFVDADDYIEEDFCKELYKKAIDKDADIVQSSYNRVTNSKVEKINTDYKEYEYNSKEYLIQTLNPQTGFGFCHMKLYRKSIIKDVRFNEELKVGEDALFGEQISHQINKAVMVRKALYNYRVNEESVVRKFDKNYVKKYLEAMIKNKEFLNKEYKDDKDIQQNYYNFVAYHVLLIAVNYCYHPENKSENKRKLLREVCEINVFKQAIKKSNFNNLSLTRKITLFSLKYKLYILTALICEFRQKQNKL